MTSKITMILFLMSGLGLINAQSAEIAAGGALIGSGGNSSIAFGNVFYQPQSGTGGTANTGTQVSYEIIPTLGADQQFINLKMEIFPNPVTERLNLKVDSKNTSNYSFEVFDAQGAKIAAQKILRPDSSLEMSAYPSGIYFFSVMEGTKIIKTFKIIRK